MFSLYLNDNHNDIFAMIFHTNKIKNLLYKIRNIPISFSMLIVFIAITVQSNVILNISLFII